VADEIFFCGTGAEIQPVSEVNGYRVGDGRIGPLTRRIEAAYHDMVRGRSPHMHWRRPVDGTVAAGARSGFSLISDINGFYRRRVVAKARQKGQTTARLRPGHD